MENRSSGSLQNSVNTVPKRAAGEDRLAPGAGPGDPGGGDQDEVIDPVRLGDRDLGRDEAAH